MTSPILVYVVGSTSSGKTSLLKQLQSMCDSGELITCPTQEMPTKGQELYSFSVPAPSSLPSSTNNTRTIDVRELGGEMAPLWEKFIHTRLKDPKGYKNTKFGLIFVFDALAPHTLPLTSVMWNRFKSAGGMCEKWPALLLLNKISARNAMTEEELSFFLLGDRGEKAQIMCVDSWTGVGLGDVMSWFVQLAFES